MSYLQKVEFIEGRRKSMTNHKPIVSRILLSSLTALASIALLGAVQPGMSQEVPIGFTVPITGASAAEGAYFIKAAKLAVKQINQAGGIKGKKINFIMQDSQSSNPGALAALNKLVEQDKVLVIVGPVKSTQILAISDAVKGFRVPMAIGGTNYSLTRKGNPWLFRCRPDDSIAAAGMVKYVKEDMKVSKVGILHDTDAFGTGGADLVEQGCKENSLTVVKRQKYTTKDKDFTAQLLSLKNAGAQVMVVYGTNPEDVATIQRQYRQLGSPYKYIGSPSSAMKDCLTLAKESAEGLMAIADYVPGESEAARKYTADYQKEYSENMDPSSAWNYDALYIFAYAIGKVGEDRAQIIKATLAIKDYKGVLGTYSFTPNGDGLHEVSVVRIEKGAHKLAKIVRVAP
jgi:branched-chain amino acid transport system substrate-binding protein